MSAMIICAICAIFNIVAAMQPDNSQAGVNWVAAGFCFGLLVATVVNKAMNR